MAANPADDYDACPDCRRIVDRLLAELDNARRFRSLPDGYVWQDYYSPDEVIRIRTEIEAERDAALATLQQVREWGETRLPRGTLYALGDIIGVDYRNYGSGS
ncbi:hypothetical protein [Gordonia amicalis]|uniref:Uncharacterized protein n=1 Tax=Gordonia amicalis TaxID=89053 RepID=A0ABU4DLM6_9ACTN|nr:hypothetical protein [Gordonia amicalis]MDV6309931.1 hypothetical protein [Gordonia amicalis]